MGGLPILKVYIIVGLDASIPLPSLLQGVFTKRVSRLRFELLWGLSMHYTRRVPKRVTTRGRKVWHKSTNPFDSNVSKQANKNIGVFAVMKGIEKKEQQKVSTTVQDRR